MVPVGVKPAKAPPASLYTHRGRTRVLESLRLSVLGAISRRSCCYDSDMACKFTRRRHGDVLETHPQLCGPRASKRIETRLEVDVAPEMTKMKVSPLERSWVSCTLINGDDRTPRRTFLNHTVHTRPYIMSGADAEHMPMAASVVGNSLLSPTALG